MMIMCGYALSLVSYSYDRVPHSIYVGMVVVVCIP